MRAGSPLVLGLGTAGLGGRWAFWPKALAPTPPLVPLLPAAGPRPRWRWRLGCPGAATVPRPPCLQPQTQVPVGPGGWGGVSEGWEGQETGFPERDEESLPLSAQVAFLWPLESFPLGHPFAAPMFCLSLRMAPQLLAASHPHSVDSEGRSQLLGEDSEVFKMLQENREGQVAPRQSSSFRLLQEALEAEERGEALGGLRWGRESPQDTLGP